MTIADNDIVSVEEGVEEGDACWIVRLWTPSGLPINLKVLGAHYEAEKLRSEVLGTVRQWGRVFNNLTNERKETNANN